MNRKIIIGRDPRCDIRIDERYDTVSNRHAELELKDDRLVFTDTSSNGTLINNQRVKGFQVTVYPGDNILLAGVYPLSWQQVSGFFPSVTRPTVTRNIHAESAGRDAYGRKPTVVVEPPSGRAGRPTEQYNRTGGGRPTQYKERNSPVPERIQSRHMPPPPPPVADTSGQELDAALRRWNWGAFLLGWVWAAFHRCYWPMFLLVLSLFNLFISTASAVAGGVGNLLIALAGIGINIYLGLNGSRIAWEAGCFDSLQHFQSKERAWRNAGFILIGVSLLIGFLLILFAVAAAMR